MADAVRPVAASEHELIALARALIGAGTASSEVRAVLSGARTMPPRISSACEAMLRDTLAKLWPALWRRGGAQPGTSIERGQAPSPPAEPAGPLPHDSLRSSIQNGQVRRGRIWERHAPIGLAFSRSTLRLLQWLIATPLAAPIGRSAANRALVTGVPGVAPLEEAVLTVGDQVMIYLALDAASGTYAQGILAAQPLVRAAPLAWLGFAELLGPPSLRPGPPPFDALCEGAGAIVVESLTGHLAQRWRAVELAKRTIAAPDALIAVGAAQDATLQGFLAACDRHRRRDLAGFVVDAAAPLLAREIAPTSALDPTAPLSRRMTARVVAGALLRAVMTWAEWDGSHRGVRFIDDDYAMAQLLLARFEPIGAAGAARAAGWLTELAALAPT